MELSVFRAMDVQILSNLKLRLVKYETLGESENARISCQIGQTQDLADNELHIERLKKKFLKAITTQPVCWMLALFFSIDITSLTSYIPR